MKNYFKFSSETKTHTAINQTFNIIGILLIPVLALYGTPFEWLMCFVGYTLWNSVGIFTGYHKLATHRQFNPPKWFKWFSILCGTMAQQGPAIHWASQHVVHHAYTDTEKDPHSPVFKGFWNVAFFLPFLTEEIKPIHSRRVITDPVYRFQADYFWAILIVFCALCYIVDPFSLVYFWLVPSGLARISVFYLTAMAHKSGEPVNNDFLGFVSAGEGWHKNHHENGRALVLHKYDWWDKFLDKYLNKKS